MIAHAGHAGTRHVIDEALRIACDKAHPLRTRRRRCEKHGRDAGFVHNLLVLPGLFRRKVDAEHAIGAYVRAIARQRFESVGEDRIKIGEEENWNFGLLAQFLHLRNDLVQTDVMFERALRGFLNDDTIRNGMVSSL